LGQFLAAPPQVIRIPVIALLLDLTLHGDDSGVEPTAAGGGGIAIHLGLRDRDPPRFAGS
jgi:hypothetical protein